MPSAPFVPAVKTARFDLRFVLMGQQVENSLYIRNDVDWDFFQLATKSAAIIAWWRANIRGNQSQDANFQEVVAVDMTTPSAPGLTTTVGAPQAGGNTNYAVPNNVTLAIKFNTALRGRSYHGRNYFIGIPQYKVVGSQIDEGWKATILTGYTALLAAVNGSGYNLVVVSKRGDKAWRTTAVMTNVLSFSADSVLDSQRRRLPGRGR